MKINLQSKDRLYESNSLEYTQKEIPKRYLRSLKLDRFDYFIIFIWVFLLYMFSFQVSGWWKLFSLPILFIVIVASVGIIDNEREIKQLKRFCRKWNFKKRL